MEATTTSQQAEALDWAQRLIRCPSVSPEEAGCYALVRSALAGLGFSFEQFKHRATTSLWAKRGAGPVQLCFSAHVDVVPPGDEGSWSFAPFAGTVEAGRLQGRGAVDMKGALGAMLAALRASLRPQGQNLPTIALLLSSSEETDGEDGTGYALERLLARGEVIELALVGEPTSTARLGDYCKIGRRGSLSLDLTVQGKQGHVAYPEQAANPIHSSLELLAALRAHSWGAANDYFGAGSLQIVGCDCANTTFNVIPNQVSWRLNWRYPPTISAAQIRAQVEAAISALALPCRLEWLESAAAFQSDPGALLPLVQTAVKEVCAITPECSTAGGTSDARFFAHAGIKVLEFGARNTGAHQVDESAEVEEIQQLSRIYSQIIDHVQH